jgi:hypothetical protein
MLHLTAVSTQEGTIDDHFFKYIATNLGNKNDILTTEWC